MVFGKGYFYTRQFVLQEQGSVFGKDFLFIFTGRVNTENVSQTDRWSLVRSTPAQKFGVARRI